MRYLLTLILMAFLASPVLADFKGPGSDGSSAKGGFKGPGTAPEAKTVTEVKNLPDNTWVELTGSIVSQVPGSKDDYIFKDSTGEINVEISHKRFMGHDVTPQNTVRIIGKVDKDFMGPIEVDVKKLEVLK